MKISRKSFGYGLIISNIIAQAIAILLANRYVWFASRYDTGNAIAITIFNILIGLYFIKPPKFSFNPLDIGLDKKVQDETEKKLEEK